MVVLKHCEAYEFGLIHKLSKKVKLKMSSNKKKPNGEPLG
jgi:hypothetical protein